MAQKLTGGARTDELMGRNGGGPEGLPYSIIVTPDGVEGAVPAGVAAKA
jgi:DNA topoisomerase-6 subunit B